MTKKKQGEWIITRRNGSCAYVGLSRGRTIAVFGGYGHEQAVSDAKRAVDCVNACRSLAIEEVRSALREARLRKAWVARKALRKELRKGGP